MNCASDDAQPTVHDLPGLVVNRIFHSLGPRDLAVAGSVCRGWREHGVDSLTDRWALRSLVTMPSIGRSAVCSLHLHGRCTKCTNSATGATGAHSDGWAPRHIEPEHLG